MLHEHRVLTTGQVARIAFDGYRSAARRLLILYTHRAVDRFRPYRPLGSAPWHYVLDTAGATVLAAEHGGTAADLGYRHDRALAIAHWSGLAHLVGVNDFFTALTGAARASSGRAGLTAWWSETHCARLWGRHAHPDGYARWQADGAEIEFFLEYDTGTEPLHRVAGKLHGYAALATATGITTPILFWLPSPRREAAFRTRAAATRAGLADPDLVPVATATPSQTVGPNGPIWLPITHDAAGQRAPRRALAGLANSPPPQAEPRTETTISQCLRRHHRTSPPLAACGDTRTATPAS